MATIGKVDFIVDFDGDTLPLQAQKIGRELGATLGKNFRDPFNKEMAKINKDIENQFKKDGVIGGSAFTQAVQNQLRRGSASLGATLASIFGDRQVFEGFVKDSGDVEQGLQHIRNALDSARESGVITGDEFNRLRLTSQNWGKTLENDVVPSLEKVGRGNDSAGGSLRRLKKDLDGANGSSKNFFNIWKELPHGFRQFAFYVALFANLATSIATLGSATGGALAIALPLLAAFGAAAGVLITGFVGTTAAISSFPAAVQPAIKALQDFYTQFRAIHQIIQTNLFAGLEGPLSNLTTVFLPALSKGLAGIATTLNGTIATAIAGLTSSGGLQLISDLFTGLQPILANLGTVALDFGAAIARIAVIALPFAQIFTGFLADIASEFNNWLASADGIATLNGVLTSTMQIFSFIGPLIAGAAHLLAGLVTKDTVTQLDNLLASVTNFFPALQGLLSALGEFNVFGIIAQLLESFGKVITPILPDINKFSEILGSALLVAIVQLQQPITDLLAAFGPLLPIVASLASSLISALVPVITALVPVITAVITAITPLISQLGPILTPIIGTLTPIITSLVNALIPIIAAVGPALTALLPTISELFIALSPIITETAGAVIELLDALLPLLAPLIQLIGLILPPLISLLSGPIVDSFTVVINVIKGVIDVLKPFLDILGGILSFIVDVFQGKWGKAWTDISGAVKDAWSDTLSFVEGAVNGIIDLVNGMSKAINSSINNLLKQIGSVTGITVKLPPAFQIPHVSFATGGIVDGSTFARIGEAGPEAVVPLDRPLSQVDPSVRAISALLQGKSDGSTAAVGGRSTTIATGAFQVFSNQPTQAASAMWDRLVAAGGV